MVRRLNARAKEFEQQFSALLHSNRDTDDDVSRAAGEIIADVRARGDAALIELSARFDRVTLTAESLRVPFAEIDAAYKGADAEVKSALSLAASRIEAYHQRQVPLDESFVDDSGRAAGLAVDGGSIRGTLCAGRDGELSELGADECACRRVSRVWRASSW